MGVQKRGGGIRETDGCLGHGCDNHGKTLGVGLPDDDWIALRVFRGDKDCGWRGSTPCWTVPRRCAATLWIAARMPIGWYMAKMTVYQAFVSISGPLRRRCIGLSIVGSHCTVAGSWLEKRLIGVSDYLPSDARDSRDSDTADRAGCRDARPPSSAGTRADSTLMYC